MLGIGAYSSDEEVVAKEAVVEKVEAPPPKPKESEKPKETPPKPVLAAARLRELQKEILNAKSATAVVHLVRRSFDTVGDIRWCADALQQIARKSTARTRKEWALDVTVKKLGDRLKTETSATAKVTANVDQVLLAMEALRRMGMADAESQKEALEQILLQLVANNWKFPFKSLARFFWLGAPLKLKGSPADFSDILPAELRNRIPESDGPDVALLLSALRKDGARDVALLEKVVVRLRSEGAHEGVSCTDLVEMGEALSQLNVRDEPALRSLGQEILRRRGELSPDESHRVHTAFQAMQLPLPQVWAQPGATKKRDASEIVTTQAFAPQEGHEKKRRGNHDLERVSPPRVVRDYKMCSY